MPPTELSAVAAWSVLVRADNAAADVGHASVVHLVEPDMRRHPDDWVALAVLPPSEVAQRLPVEGTRRRTPSRRARLDRSAARAGNRSRACGTANEVRGLGQSGETNCYPPTHRQNRRCQRLADPALTTGSPSLRRSGQLLQALGPFTRTRQATKNEDEPERQPATVHPGARPRSSSKTVMQRI